MTVAELEDAIVFCRRVHEDMKRQQER